MTKRKKVAFWLVATAALAAAGVVYTRGPAKVAGKGIVYDTVAVSRGAIRKTVSTTGPVRALVTVSVGSQLSGQVAEVLVDFNSPVKHGDLLARIDDKTYAARVAQARADLAVAEAALANQNAALTKAEAVEKLATRSVERQQTLATKGFSAQSSLDTATRDRDVARADIIVARAQITSAKAQIDQRRAALSQAETDLERTEIRAPIDGTVISRTVDPGQTVAASLQSPELFKIAQDLSRIRIEAQVNEADVGAVAEGNEATFTVDAYPDQQFQGRVSQVRLAATEINNVVTYTVIIEAANEARKLFPGMTANVTIVSASRDGVLRLSNDALRYKPKVDPAEQGAAGAADRMNRLVERLKVEITMTPEQEKAVREALDRLAKEQREQSPAGFSAGAPADPAAFRQRATSRIEQALTPLLTDTQKPLFDQWRKGREQQRSATVWVLSAEEKPERRFVRTGVADEQWTEVTGGNLTEGDRLITRAKEQGK